MSPTSTLLLCQAEKQRDSRVRLEVLRQKDEMCQSAVASPEVKRRLQEVGAHSYFFFFYFYYSGDPAEEEKGGSIFYGQSPGECPTLLLLCSYSTPTLRLLNFLLLGLNHSLPGRHPWPSCSCSSHCTAQEGWWLLLLLLILLQRFLLLLLPLLLLLLLPLPLFRLLQNILLLLPPLLQLLLLLLLLLPRLLLPPYFLSRSNLSPTCSRSRPSEASGQGEHLTPGGSPTTCRWEGAGAGAGYRAARYESLSAEAPPSHLAPL